MYCKHCGKEIADDSKFCQYCGNQQVSQQKGMLSKPFWVIYLVWAIANLYLLMGEKFNDASRYFYPFTTQYSLFGSIRCHSWDKDYYDFSEFIVYVFILPTVLYVIYKRYNEKIDKFVNRVLNKK